MMYLTSHVARLGHPKDRCRSNRTGRNITSPYQRRVADLPELQLGPATQRRPGSYPWPFRFVDAGHQRRVFPDTGSLSGVRTPFKPLALVCGEALPRLPSEALMRFGDRAKAGSC